MADIKWTTGVDLAGLTSGLAQARARIAAFGHTSNITVSLRVNYVGPTAAHLASITAAITALHGAASTPINLGLGGLANIAVGGAGLAGLTHGVYELAKASDDARISNIAFEKQVSKNGYSFDEAAQAVGRLESKLKISKTEAQRTIGDMLKAGASINQAVSFAEAGAASSLGAGKAASVGIQAVTESLLTGLSAPLNNAGISQNISTYLQQIAREAGKTTDALSDMEKAKAMEKLLNEAVILPGELAMLETAMGGVSGKTGEMNANLQAMREQLGKPLVGVVTAILDRMAGTLLAVSKTSPETVTALAKVALGLGLAAVAWNSAAIAAGLATAATNAYTAALTKLSAAGTAVSGAPWMAVAIAAGLALTAVTAYYTKVSEEEAKRVQQDVDRLNKDVQGARDGTAGTEFDDRAAAMATRINVLGKLAAQAKANLKELAQTPGVSADSDLFKGVLADYEKYNRALEGTKKAMASLKDVASDKEAMAGWKEQLEGAEAEQEKKGLDSLGKALADVKKRYDALEVSAKKTFKTDAAQQAALRDVEKLREAAVDQATAKLAAEAAAKGAEAERNAEKARINALEDGLGKRSALRELEIEDVQAKYSKLKQEYKAFPEARVQFEDAAQKEISAIRQKGLREDEAYVEQVTKKLADQLKKARVEALEGEAKLRGQAGNDLADLRQSRTDDLAKVKGDPQATERVKATYAELSTLRQQALARDLREEAETQRKATQERLDSIRQSELAGYQAAADARVSVAERAQQRELAAAQGNQQKELAVYTRHAQAIADARAEAARTAARAEADSALTTARRNASEKGVTPGEAARITAQARLDASRILSRAEADVADIYATSREDLASKARDAAKEAAERSKKARQDAVEEGRAIREAAIAAGSAQADYAAAVASTAEQEAAARQANLAALREELALKRQIAANMARDPNAKRSEVQAAENAATQAATALANGERQAREAANAERLRSVDLAGKQLAFEHDMARTAAERLSVEQRQQQNLSQRLTKLQGNLSGAQTLEERRTIEAQITETQREQEKLGRTIEGTQKSVLEEVNGVNAAMLQRAQLEGDYSALVARSLAEQTAARERNLQTLRDEVAEKLRLQGQAFADPNTTQEQRAAAGNAVLSAQNNLIRGEQQAREAVNAERLRAVDLTARELDHELSMAKTARERLAIGQRQRGNLADRIATLNVNLSQAQTLEEQRRITDQITEAQRQQQKLSQGILNTQREVTAERLRENLRPLDQLQQQIEFEQQLTVSAQVREQLAGREREALGARMTVLAAAAREADTVERQRELQDQLTASQQSYAKSLEESRKARLGELDAQRDLRASVLDAALSNATSLSGRTGARLNLVTELRDQVRLADAQVTLYQQQGRAQSEINAVVNARQQALDRIKALSKEQLADQERLLELSEQLTSKNRELAALAVQTYAEGSEQRRVAALTEMQRATTNLTRSTRAYLDQQRALAPLGVVSESNADKLGKAMDRQQQAVQRATQALAALRGEASAQKAVFDQLLGNVQNYAAQAGDQKVLDRLKDRAGQALTGAISEREQALRRYGATSQEFAAADQRVAETLQLASNATRAAAENRSKALQDTADAQQRAHEQMTRVAELPSGAQKLFDLKQAKIGDQVTAIKLSTDEELRALAQAASTMSAPLFAALDGWQARLKETDAAVKAATADLQRGTSGLAGVTIKVDPKVAEESGSVFGEAAVQPLTRWARETLANLRAATVVTPLVRAPAQTSVVNHVTNNNINGLSVRMDVDMQRQFREFLRFCQMQQAQNNAGGVAQ